MAVHRGCCGRGHGCRFHGTIAAFDQRWNLISPIAAMAQATMQQDYRCANSVSAIPDAGSVMFDRSGIVCDGKWRGAVRFESSQLIVVRLPYK